MPKLNIDPTSLVQIKTILKQWAPNAEVWAYGSRVNGKCHEASDLDLVIRQPHHLQKPTEHLSQLKQALKDSNVPIIVDVMDWAYLPESYRVEIQNHFVVVQKQ